MENSSSLSHALKGEMKIAQIDQHTGIFELQKELKRSTTASSFKQNVVSILYYNKDAAAKAG